MAGACASEVSPLVGLLEKGHYDIELSRDERDRLYTWLDTYGQRQGSFGEDQERRLDELRGRMAKMLAR